MVEDPTLSVLGKVQDVLDELKVHVSRYDLYELRSSITTLPQTLKDADAVILAVTVEWFGIGGIMQDFLDACWLYGDKDKIASIYMFPVVMAKTYGEREAALTLSNAWEILGGKAMNGICAYVDEDAAELEDDTTALVEKMAENVYRTVSQQVKTFPSSNAAMKRALMKETLQLTPQESEQLSRFVANDKFVATQKQDIQDLAGMFMEMLDDEQRGGDDYYISTLKTHYEGRNGFDASYIIVISDKQKTVSIKANGQNADISLVSEGSNNADVVGKMEQQVFDDIVYGRMTFQRAFMTGAMTAKGDFRILRTLDEIFKF